ncbi:hypothetical protein Cni_G08774 [Canna indica]|uniref:Uncharacterized protein n=1 Tax=Canna indica TaxID=4628 RepID=A0AAQ3Q869_9LILI|nr:hypothetical protein Cni_G08774 [Canna indica]
MPSAAPPHSMQNASIHCARDSDEEANGQIRKFQGGRMVVCVILFVFNAGYLPFNNPNLMSLDLPEDLSRPSPLLAPPRATEGSRIRERKRRWRGCGERRS